MRVDTGALDNIPFKVTFKSDCRDLEVVGDFFAESTYSFSLYEVMELTFSNPQVTIPDCIDADTDFTLWYGDRDE
jgi:hypothetical protein